MVQPICVLYIPEHYSFEKSGRTIDPIEFMTQFNGWPDRHSPKRDSVGGYVWFCFFKDGITEPVIKTYYSENFTPIQYDELKEMIEKNWAEYEKIKTNK